MDRLGCVPLLLLQVEKDGDRCYCVSGTGPGHFLSKRPCIKSGADGADDAALTVVQCALP